MNRRHFLTGLGGLAATGLAAELVLDAQERFQRAAVMIAGAPSYEHDLEAIIRSGLGELGIGPGRSAASRSC